MVQNFIDSLRIRKSDFPTPEEALDKAHACDIISKDIYTDNTRFVYELLQNADDASCKSGKLIFRIDFVGDHLVVSHCGKAFTEDDIESICSIGDGTKSSDTEQTGFKGIGFKSVFAHSKSVIIKSGVYCFKFDQEESVIWNSKWGDRSAWEQLRAQKGKDIRVKMPWQVIPIITELPSDVKHLLDGMPEYTVSTIIKCREIEDMKNSITELFSTSQLILFLRSKDVSITINGTQPLSIIKTEMDGVTIISKNGDVVSQWLMYTTLPFDVPTSLREKMSEDSDHYPEKLREAKKASMSFAIAIKEGKIVKIDSDLNNIFAFLPTSVDSYKLPFIVNANFITDASRQNLHKDYVWNQWLFEEMPKHYMSFIKEIAQSGKYGLEFLKVVIKSTESSDALGEKFANGMSEALEQIAFLPIGDRLLKTSDAIFDETNVFSCLSSNMLIDFLSANGTQYVSNNILPQSYSSFAGVLRKLSVFVFGADQLLDFLKSETFKSSHNVSENANLIKFLSHRYPEPHTEDDKNKDYSWLKELPFIFSKTMQLRSPSSLCFPNVQYVAQVENSFDTIAGEVYNALESNCINWLKWLGMSEPTDTSLIDTGKLFEEGFVTINNTIDITRYLFELHKNASLNYLHYSQLHSVKILTQQGTLKSANNLYLSDIYIPETPLEKNVKQDMFISSSYIRDVKSISEWRTFWEKIGVTTGLKWQTFNILAKNSSKSAQVFGTYIDKVFEVSSTFFWESYKGWYDTGWRFVPSSVFFYGIPFLNYTTRHDFSKLLWSNVLKTSSLDDVRCSNSNIRVNGVTGMIPRELSAYNLSSKGVDTSYLHWSLHNNSIIPALDGKCYPADEVYSNAIPNAEKLLGTYLPVFDCDELACPEWEDILDLKKQIGLSEYLQVLSKISECDASESSEKERVSLLYTEMARLLPYLSDFQKEDIKSWAVNHKILAKDDHFYSPSCLSIVLVDGFASDRFAYIGREHPSDEIIDLMKLMGVKVIDHVTPSFSSQPIVAEEISVRLRSIAPLIACINGNQNSDPIIETLEKLSIYSVDGISLSYGNQTDLISKTVYYNPTECSLYYKGDWKSPRVLDGLEQPLGKVLHLNKANCHMLSILLSTPLTDCIDYLNEYGVQIPDETINLLKSNELVNSCEVKSEKGEFIEVSLEDTIYGGLSKRDMADYLKSAKDIVRLELESQNYDFSEAYGLDASTFGNVYGVKDPQGIVCPLVVHSYRNNAREFTLTAMDWEQLAKRNSMLWIVTNDGARCVQFYKLMENRGRISLSFNVDNCAYQERMTALAEILRYFKGLKFNFGSLQDTFTNIAVRFNQPEKALAEKLGADDLDMLW